MWLSCAAVARVELFFREKSQSERFGHVARCAMGAQMGFFLLSQKRMDVMDIDYLLTGYHDGQYTEIRGTGRVDRNSGFYLDLEPVFVSPTWDPGIIILICCNNLVFYSANLDNAPSVADLRDRLTRVAFERDPGQPGRGGILVNDDGETVVSVTARGFLEIETNRVVSRTIIDSATSTLNKHGGISNISTPYTERITATVVRRALGLSRYELQCEDGTRLHGSSYFRYKFSENVLIDDVALNVSVAQANWADYRRGAKPHIQIAVSGAS
jgi:hypothetical protein